MITNVTEGTVRSTIGQLRAQSATLVQASADNLTAASRCRQMADDLAAGLPVLHPLIGNTLSGLAWPNGVFTGNAREAPVSDFTTWRGRPLDVLLWFATTSRWPTYFNTLPVYLRDFAGLRVMTMGLVPFDQVCTLSAAATGTYDPNWVRIGQMLHDQGFDDGRTMLRLGHEMNGNWYPWSAKDPASFRTAYQRAVDGVRQFAPTTRFSWCANKGTSRDSHWLEALPSDDHVDVYGIDPYDGYTPSYTDADWKANGRRGPGLMDVVDLAQSKGKMIGIEEWACSARFVTSAGQTYDGGGDNPFYVQKMWEFCNAYSDLISHEIAYDDPGSAFHQRAAQPMAWAKYRSLWGQA